MEKRFTSLIHFQKLLLEMSHENMNHIKDEITQSSFLKTKRKLKNLLNCINIVSEIRPTYHHYIIELIQFLSEYIRSFFESEELLNLFNNNLSIVLILYELKIITIESIFTKALQSTHYFLFFQFQLLDYSHDFVRDYWRQCKRKLLHLNIH